MSYQKSVDEMVGRHVAHYQEELTSTHELGQALNKEKPPPPMPYGYPIAIYRPMHICKAGRFHPCTKRLGERLSNGVPKVIATEIVEGSLLGVYNRKAA